MASMCLCASACVALATQDADGYVRGEAHLAYDLIFNSCSATVTCMLLALEYLTCRSFASLIFSHALGGAAESDSSVARSTGRDSGDEGETEYARLGADMNATGAYRPASPATAVVAAFASAATVSTLPTVRTAANASEPVVPLSSLSSRLSFGGERAALPEWVRTLHISVAAGTFLCAWSTSLLAFVYDRATYRAVNLLFLAVVLGSAIVALWIFTISISSRIAAAQGASGVASSCCSDPVTRFRLSVALLSVLIPLVVALQIVRALNVLTTTPRQSYDPQLTLDIANPLVIADLVGLSFVIYLVWLPFVQPRAMDTDGAESDPRIATPTATQVAPRSMLGGRVSAANFAHAPLDAAAAAAQPRAAFTSVGSDEDAPIVAVRIDAHTPLLRNFAASGALMIGNGAAVVPESASALNSYARHSFSGSFGARSQLPPPLSALDEDDDDDDGDAACMMNTPPPAISPAVASATSSRLATPAKARTE